MNRQERIAAQDAAVREDARHARPGERSTTVMADDSRGPHYWPCPAALGRRHDISMRRPGGGSLVCWYCCKTSQQLRDERATEAA